MEKAVVRSKISAGELEGKLESIRRDLYDLEEQMFGNQSKQLIGEKRAPTVYSRLWFASSGIRNNTYGPTPEHIRNLEIAESEFREIRESLTNIIDKRIPALEEELISEGAPWIEGQPIPGSE